MASIDEIAERAARDLRADVRGVTDVDAGLRAIVGDAGPSTSRPPRRTWWVVIGWSVAATAAVLVTFLVVRDDSVGTVVPATTPPTQPSTTAESTEPSTGSTTAPSVVTAAGCDEVSLLAAVSSLFPENANWNPTGVTVDACRGGFAQVVALADQSTCPTVGQQCYENEQVWFQDIDGVWTYLDSGTGIGCAPGETSPAIEPACLAFSTTNVTLRLPADAAVVSAVAVAGGQFDGGAAAVAPDGFIVISQAVRDRARLWTLRVGSAPVDAGVSVAKNARLWFAPSGNLYAIEHDEGFVDWKVVFFTRTNDGRLSLESSATGPVDGECIFVADDTGVGCSNGPRVQMESPTTVFDHVIGDPLLAGVDGRGVVVRTGSVVKRWTVGLDVATPINCDDNTCAELWQPGPNGSALYVPYLDTPEGGNHLAVFVLGDQPTSGGVRLEGADAVLGLVGRQLYGLHYTDTGARLVVFDLSSLLPWD